MTTVVVKKEIKGFKKGCPCTPTRSSEVKICIEKSKFYRLIRVVDAADSIIDYQTEGAPEYKDWDLFFDELATALQKLNINEGGCVAVDSDCDRVESIYSHESIKSKLNRKRGINAESDCV